ncbi:MAG TPA: nicotinate phosphoribosyltransferase [Calditerricola sp.]
MTNLTMLTDLYQLNMMYAYWKSGIADKRVVFDLYFRRPPFGNGYAVCAGLEQALEAVLSLAFTEDDLAYLKSIHPYEEAFLDELRRFRFTGDIWAIPEGTVVFPYEPLLRVEARVFEAQLLETALLNLVNHQTLIATKAARVVEAASGDGVLEFGLRRAQGPDAGLYGARAAYIGGAEATSNVLAGKRFGIPVRGTHAHAFVMSFPSELEAFRAFAAAFPNNAVLLVDTYDTLRSGVPNAIRVGQELRARGYDLAGIRLDSGDLAYLSKEARRMLDAAGFTKTRIVASSDLDELLIRDLKVQGAAIDTWGVGTHLITAKDDPALTGVYKLVAEEENGRLIPRIKVSENPGKVTIPGKKKVIRFYDRDTGEALADLIMLHDEPVPTGEPFEIFDPVHPYRRKTLSNYEARELLVPVVIGGQPVYDLPSLDEVRRYSREELSRFSPEVRRLVNPHEYPVDLSEALWNLRNRLLLEARRR